MLDDQPERVQPMAMMRPYSHVGWLMLQWLGVLVPGAFRDEVRRAAQAQGKSVYQRTPNVQPGAQARFMGEAEAVEIYPDTVTGRARRLVAKINERLPVRAELFDVDPRVEAEEAARFEVGEVMTWPNVESMLRGELPEGYDAALLRHAVAGDGVAVTRVDPVAGTVTVSRARCPGCGAWLGGTYGSVCMTCEVDS